MIGKYLIFRPGVKGNLGEEWRQCLRQIIYKREPGYRLIKLNIFTDLPDYETYIKVNKEIRKTIFDAFGNQSPAYNITTHPPEQNWKVSVEAGYANTDSSDIFSNVWDSIPYIVSISEAGKELWAGGLGSGLFPDDTRRASESAFSQMKGLLESEGMSMNHLVRQWNYIGNILATRDGFQNYQIFNEVRSEYYQKYRTVQGYPAATGIGMKFGGVTIDFCAVMPDEEMTIKAIANPDQVNAYEYGQEVLKGMPAEGKPLKQPPQFERSLLLSRKINSTLFISGTAAIIGQDTIGIEDVEKQTIVTIENISKLTEQRRITSTISNNDLGWGNFILLRVYVKNRNDFPKVEFICRDRFPDVPAVFVGSDICRDNLLVEIEAEFLINN
jgi:enamine deaminase RidA (YjgF/YER057c/UK114 family)